MSEAPQLRPERVRRRADELFQRGFAAQMQGELDKALQLYTRSIRAYPTAEAYTLRGWTYSFQGDYERAIEECQRAIALDPDLGNPYNDIGAYLIEIGRTEEAVPWLRKALRVRDYRFRCYAEFNLGRAYERQQQRRVARRHYEKALALNPGYAPAQRALARLQAAVTSDRQPGCTAPM